VPAQPVDSQRPSSQEWVFLRLGGSISAPEWALYGCCGSQGRCWSPLATTSRTRARAPSRAWTDGTNLSPPTAMLSLHSGSRRFPPSTRSRIQFRCAAASSLGEPQPTRRAAILPVDDPIAAGSVQHLPIPAPSATSKPWPHTGPVARSDAAIRVVIPPLPALPLAITLLSVFGDSWWLVGLG